MTSSDLLGPLGIPLDFKAVQKGKNVVLHWKKPQGREVEGYIVSAGADLRHLKNVEIIESRKQSFRLVLKNPVEGEIYALCSYMGAKSSKTIFATTSGPYENILENGKAPTGDDLEMPDYTGSEGEEKTHRNNRGPFDPLETGRCSCCIPPRTLEKREGGFFCPGHPEVKYSFRKRKEKSGKENTS